MIFVDINIKHYQRTPINLFEYSSTSSQAKLLEMGYLMCLAFTIALILFSIESSLPFITCSMCTSSTTLTQFLLLAISKHNSTFLLRLTPLYTIAYIITNPESTQLLFGYSSFAYFMLIQSRLAIFCMFISFYLYYWQFWIRSSMFVTTADRKCCLRCLNSEGDFMGMVKKSLSLVLDSGLMLGLDIFEAFFIYSNLLQLMVSFWKHSIKKLGSQAKSSALSRLSRISALSGRFVAMTLYLARGTMSPLPNLLNSSKVTQFRSADSIMIISLTSSMLNSSLMQSNTNTKSSSVITLSLLMSMMLNALKISSSEKVSLFKQYPVSLLLCSVWGWTVRGMGYSTSCWMDCGMEAWMMGWIDGSLEQDSGCLDSGPLILIWQSKVFQQCR